MTEWQKQAILSAPRLSPPPAAPQKVHGVPATGPLQSRTTNQPAGHKPSGSPAATLKPSASSLPPQQFHQASSPEMDLDVNGMSPEPEGQSEEAAMGSVAGDGGGDNDAIIRQLEGSLPRWEGFGDSGWMSEVSKVRIIRVGPLQRVRMHRLLFQLASTMPRLRTTTTVLYRTACWKSWWRSKATKTSCSSAMLSPSIT